MANMTAGNFTDALRCSLETAFPYGLFYVLLGFILLAVVMKKTKSYSMVGITMLLYSLAVSTVVDSSMMPYIFLIIGVSVMILLLSIFLGVRRKGEYS